MRTAFKNLMMAKEYPAFRRLGFDLIKESKELLTVCPVEEVENVRGRIRGITDLMNTIEHIAKEGGNETDE